MVLTNRVEISHGIRGNYRKTINNFRAFRIFRDYLDIISLGKCYSGLDWANLEPDQFTRFVIV